MMMKKKMFYLMLIASAIMGMQACSSEHDDAEEDMWDEGMTRQGTISAALDDNNVDVTWSGTDASVAIASNLSGLVSATIKGGHVCLLAADEVADEVTYTLSGSSDNGSLYMNGSYKATFVLNGLTLTSNRTDSAAINIRNGKRINIVLSEGTTNTLADRSGGKHKACFMVKGHVEFHGGGALSLAGNTGHAFWSKEYCEVKASTGSITVTGAKGDGLNVNQYFLMNGGTVSVSGVGDDGLQVGYKTDDNDRREAGEENTGEVIIQGGTLTIATPATGSKGIKAEGNITINESKGSTAVSVVSAANEGIETKAAIDISGGTVSAQGKDDAINSSGDLTISGGYTYAYSVANDGLDANGNMYIKGGVAVAFGGNGAETGVDVDERHRLYLSGGELFGMGGRTDSNMGSSTQAYGIVSHLSGSGYFILSQGNTHLFAVKLPTSSYQGTAVVSSSGMSSGTTYSVGAATSVSGTEINGFIASPTVGSVSNAKSFTARK